MKRISLLTIAVFLATLCCKAQLTLDYCIARADENYPLIRKYGLIEQSQTLALSDINRGWLPRIGVYAQATAQSDVPSFPGILKGMIADMGQEINGIGRVQYKAGVDISQTIWDGGSSKARREAERTAAAESTSATDVRMYEMHEKVMNLFFGILLMDEQIVRTETTLTLLNDNLRRMQAMYANGTAMQSDVDIIEAQILAMSQQLTEARSAVQSYRNVLELYIGEEIGERTLLRLAETIPSTFDSARPELAMYDARLRHNAAQKGAVSASVMPHFGLFAQAYYGYPGFNYFESMINRDLSFNLLAGIKMSWNIDSFYTRRNSIRRLAVAADGIENDSDIFLFNSRLQATSQSDKIDGLRKIMKDDSRIVALRTDIRRAAESQLDNGVIDATSLLTKITDENQAHIAASYHEIQLLQHIYQLKYILNR